jgi:hypothetical protein
MNLAYSFYSGLGNTSMVRLTVCRQDFFGNLGKQSEKSERCQSHARVSSEPSHGLGIVFPILRTLPLSGRQGAWGGAAESFWRPVHSRGLFEGLIDAGNSSAAHQVLLDSRQDSVLTPISV